MNKVILKPRALIGYMANASGESKTEISRKLGREKNYMGQYTFSGRIPNVALLTKMARACGYEVHIIGHGEDITLEVDDAE